jgi:hypothetical protein
VRDRPATAPATAAPPVDETPEAKAMRERFTSMLTPGSLASRSLGLASVPYAAGNNSPEWRSAQLPAANGHTTARSLARMYGALARGGEVDGVRLLSPEAVRRAADEQVRGPDAVLVMETRRSLGFMLPVPGQPDNRGPGPGNRLRLHDEQDVGPRVLHDAGPAGAVPGGCRPRLPGRRLKPPEDHPERALHCGPGPRPLEVVGDESQRLPSRRPPTRFEGRSDLRLWRRPALTCGDSALSCDRP